MTPSPKNQKRVSVKNPGRYLVSPGNDPETLWGKNLYVGVEPMTFKGASDARFYSPFKERFIWKIVPYKRGKR